MNPRLRTGLMIGAASLALGIVTTAAMAGAGAGPGFAPMAGPPGFSGPMPAQPAPCTPPALAGAIVDVTTSDMGAMMGPGMNGGPMMGPGMNGGPMTGPGMMGPGMNGGPMMGPQGAGPNSPGMGMGMMRLSINPASMPARLSCRGSLSRRTTISAPFCGDRITIAGYVFTLLNTGRLPRSTISRTSPAAIRRSSRP